MRLMMSNFLNVPSLFIFVGFIVTAVQSEMIVLGRKPKVTAGDGYVCTMSGFVGLKDIRVEDVNANDPHTLICTVSILHIAGDLLDFGRGQDTILSTGSCLFSSLESYTVRMGEDKDTIICNGLTLNDAFGDSLLDLGSGDDFLSSEERCHISGTLDAGDGHDTIQCASTVSRGLSVFSTLNLGNGQDVVTVNGGNGNFEACLVSGGGKILGEEGADQISCHGGSAVGLRVRGIHSGVGSMVDMGGGIDHIYVENDIVIESPGRLLLGNDADTITTEGCLRGDGIIDMGDGPDSIYAKAVNAEINGGEGIDCYQPTTDGEYNLDCNENNEAILTAPSSVTCDDVDGAPVATLVSIERIGCNPNSFVGVPTCPAKRQITVTVSSNGDSVSRTLARGG